MKEFITHLLIMTGIILPTLIFSHWFLIIYLMLEPHNILTGGMIVGFITKVLVDIFTDDLEKEEK